MESGDRILSQVFVAAELSWVALKVCALTSNALGPIDRTITHYIRHADLVNARFVR